MESQKNLTWPAEHHCLERIRYLKRWCVLQVNSGTATDTDMSHRTVWCELYDSMVCNFARCVEFTEKGKGEWIHRADQASIFFTIYLLCKVLIVEKRHWRICWDPTERQWCQINDVTTVFQSSLRRSQTSNRLFLLAGEQWRNIL